MDLERVMRAHRAPLLQLLLIAVLLRAFVPVGFMPVPGSLLTLELCRAEVGLTEPRAPLDRHDDHRAPCEQGAFCHAPCAGPATGSVALAIEAAPAVAPLSTPPTTPARAPLLRAQRARAPPQHA